MRKTKFQTLVDEKTSFFQAKIEKNDGSFKIKPRQWYLMRYWPNFFYKKKPFTLESCSKVPDVCSFYLLLFKKNVLDYTFVDNSKTCNCEINSVCLSTPYMEEKMPILKNLDRNGLVKNNDVSLRLTQKDGDGFIGMMWDLLLTHLGAHDSQGSMLMTTMFQEAFKASNPSPRKETRKRPSIGISVKVQLKTEGLPREL